MADERVPVEIDGRALTVSNLDKVLYPATGLTKAGVIDYYARVADTMLPHLRGRPLTMVRHPDGVDGPSFFEKRCPGHRPAWMGTVRLGREGREKVVDHCDLRERADLVWAANLAALELHTPMGAAPDPSRPTMVVFDLDPGPPADVVTCARVALLLREVFARLDLEAWPKTSGSKGLQVYVPVNQPDTDYDTTRGFALAVGQLLERVHPELVLTRMDRADRTNRVFVDWSQNHLVKTTVCAYSLRARPEPTVSTPVTWDEVAAGADGSPADLTFRLDAVLERIAAHGDLFADVLVRRQRLPDLG